jgi:hypothetical protein
MGLEQLLWQPCYEGEMVAIKQEALSQSFKAHCQRSKSVARWGGKTFSWGCNCRREKEGELEHIFLLVNLPIGCRYYSMNSANENRKRAQVGAICLHVLDTPTTRRAAAMEGILMMKVTTHETGIK